MAAASNKSYLPLAKQLRRGTAQICWLQGELFNKSLFVGPTPLMPVSDASLVGLFRFSGSLEEFQ